MSDRVAFITGAGSGLGRAIARRLASGGAAVVVADVDPDSGAATASEIDGLFVACDVADLAAVRSARDEVVSQWGGIDVLVNNAGFDIPAIFLDGDPGTWERLIAVNLLGTLNCVHAIAPVIVQRSADSGYGRVVNVASDAGRVGSLGEAVYSAAKGGVIAFTKSMARELARSGVTVNAVCPGPADTPMTERLRTEPLGEVMIRNMVKATPLKRLAAPDEVAEAVAFFASEDARFVTGQALSVSGGLTMSD